MRKLLIAGLLLLGATVFAGNYENELTERMKAAEEKAQTGWDSGVRADMVNASLDLDKEWEKEMNKVYDLIIKKLSAKEKTKFKDEQNKWLKDREVKVQKAYEKYTEEEGPRMAGELAANERLDITKNRVLELAKKYDGLNKSK
ncbi:lysozyme inhibitor LprI family protein [Leptotrichia sp. oral taxon 879]|uniref:lysozyme inhibitor LprI family protein n=1 Tax=Leptotrichia sp. oral taxon 879 TaxID=1227267 RepID=UPI0003AE59B5|nr:lysozyme inhibitor LprI family protein [Leptotrichia sp. oral taxon 879]ERK47728.1 hypothetical protein HMPREF1552_02316 [Leptotrichia sp. oral taxon 879 str. F0557]